MAEDRHIYGEVNSKTDMKCVFTGIRRDVKSARLRPALTELYKGGAKDMYITYDLDQRTRGGGSALLPKLKRVYIAGDVEGWMLGDFRKGSGAWSTASESSTSRAAVVIAGRPIMQRAAVPNMTSHLPAFRKPDNNSRKSWNCPSARETFIFTRSRVRSRIDIDTPSSAWAK